MDNENRISAESDEHFINASRDESSAEIDSLLDEVEGTTDTTEETTTTTQEPVTTTDDNILDDEPATQTTEPTKPTEATVTQEPTTDTETTTTEESDDIEEPRNLSEANSNNWKKLRESRDEYKTKASEYEAKIAEYEAKLAEASSSTATLPPDYEELKKFKQTFDLKNDPEFHSKYDTPITQATETIYSVLKKNGAADSVIEDIKKIGGPNQVSDAWWKETIGKLPMTDQERVKKALVDTVDLSERKEQEIAEVAANAEQILESRKTKTVEWYKTETQEIANHVEELTKGHDWARYQRLPDNATEDQIKAVQSHNAKVQDLATKFNSALWPQTAKERAEVAAAAVYSHVLNDQLSRVAAERQEFEARVKALEKENSLLKASGRLPKATASSTGGKIAPSTDERIKMNASDAIDLGLDEALNENQ